MNRIRLILGSAVVAMCVAASGIQAQSGDIGANQIVVNNRSHWENWEIPEGIMEITPSGSLELNRWRRATNTSLDIVDNLRWNPPEGLAKKAPEDITLLDAIQAGSNRNDVVNALDGSLTTYWEPEIPSGEVDLSAQWWFTVDLGRIVVLDSIVVRFVEEGSGDPFLLFDVLVTNGQKPAAALQGSGLEFRPVLQTLQRNKTQRVFVADLSTTLVPVFSSCEPACGSTPANTSPLDPGKRVARFVQIVVHGSDLERGHLITEAEYNQLLDASPEDAGATEYVKLLSSGGEAVMEQADYDRLDAELQGGVRYYRRERPRLAELEVWGPGDDLASGAVRRNGGITNSSILSVRPTDVIDGDITTLEKHRRSSVDPFRFTDEIFMDLGAFFWINGFNMVSGRPGSNAQGSQFNVYRLEFSDGSLELDGVKKKWRTVVERDGNSVGFIVSTEEFPPMAARFFRLVWDNGFEAKPADILGDARTSEIQLFGFGYPPQVELTSDLIRLGGSRNLTTIEWDADLDSGTRVELQTRSGDTLDDLILYYKKGGTEPISEAAYNKIRIKSQKGPIDTVQVAGSDWEPWSEPYELASGSEITSPSPREFLKIRATVLSDDPESRATLKEIRLNFSQPVAGSLEAQVIPNRVDSLGVEVLFSLFVEIGSLEQGFDELLVRPPPGMEVSFDPARESVFAGLASAFEEGADLSGQALDNVQVLAASTDSLHLSFDPVESGVEVMRLDFRGRLFSAGGRLQALLRNSEGDGFWQRVDEKTPRNSLQLVAQPKRKTLFGDLTITPPVFSPNGDTVNDELTLNFTVMMVGGSTAVEAEIFDLSGRRVRRLQEQRQVSSGTYSITWDGTDEANRLLPPGLYTVRLKLDTDTDDIDVGRKELLHTIALTY